MSDDLVGRVARAIVMDRPRPNYSQAEVQRAMRAAKKEGFSVIELTPTPHGVKNASKCNALAWLRAKAPPLSPLGF